MAKKAIGINIPAGAEPNINADDHAALFHALAGGDGELSEITCTRISDNLVRLSAGDILVKGHQLRVPGGSTHELAVESGTLGMNRNDLIVAQYVRRESEEESDTLEFAVVKGTPTAGEASDPELVQEDIDNPAYTTRQIALFRLPIVETTLGTPVKLVNLVDNLARLTAAEGDIDDIEASLGNINKPLWSGNWTSGDITVTGSSAYRVFLVDLGTTISLLAVKGSAGTLIRGINGTWQTSSLYQGTPLFEASISGETWTLVASNRIYHQPLDGHTTTTDMAVTAINGLF
jgi:hypothetical protein